MPDLIHSHAQDGAPLSWSDAFAALPQETPPGDGWSRVAAQLQVRASRPGTARRERRAHWLLGLASAAVLVVAAWAPLSAWLQSDGDRQEPTLAAANAPGFRRPAAPAQVEPRNTASVDRKSAGRMAAADEPAATVAVSAQPVQRRQHDNPHYPVKRPPAATIAAQRLARTTPQPASVQTSVASADTAATAAASDPLEQLKLQSAQLEALVAMARDDRVGNASNELLISELDAGIAQVDAALSQAGLADTRKQELWQQRVELLQQLAGVEATSRWLAAQGTSNDTLLVSVD